jgi:hypothetical protein
MLDRKMEQDLSTLHKRLRKGTFFGGKFPQVPGIRWENVPLPDRKKINTSFNRLMKDKDGVTTETDVENMLGGKNGKWTALTRDEQQQTVAAYVTKLVHRKVISLKTNLRDGEIRALSSGPFANELIKVGLIRNPDFRQEASSIPGIDASNLDNPTPDTLQQIKGRLDKDNLFSLLMLGLMPLSLMKQEGK